MCHFTKLHSTTQFFRSKKAMRVMRFSYFGSGKFSAVDRVFDIDKTHLELTICPRHRDMFDGTKGFSTTGKLSPTKIPSSRLASLWVYEDGSERTLLLRVHGVRTSAQQSKENTVLPCPRPGSSPFYRFQCFEIK